MQETCEHHDIDADIEDSHKHHGHDHHHCNDCNQCHHNVHDHHHDTQLHTIASGAFVLPALQVIDLSHNAMVEVRHNAGDCQDHEYEI